MVKKLSDLYFRLTLGKPWVSLLLVVLLLGFLASFMGRFKLDASGDSLVLETDLDYQYYQSISAKYPGEDFVVITYSPKADLFSRQTMDKIKSLREQLKKLPRVGNVVTYLDVPLIRSPKIGFKEIQQEIRTLENADTDPELARKELTSSPIYNNRLVSTDGKTTAIQVVFKRDKKFMELKNARNRLQEKRLQAPLTEAENAQLRQITADFQRYSSELQDQEAADIRAIRGIIDGYRDGAEIYLGGIPMIVADMIEYVGNDINVFGIGVVAFIILLLFVSFRRPRWVFIPVGVCLGSVIGMVGFLGLLEWKVTVVSSNFISLLLIITLSLMVHLIVRFLELHRLNPDGAQKEFLLETIRSKVEPSIYTVTTTMVAFGSLVVSGIRPVIDFGWMMVFGVGLAFILAFLVFPSSLIYFRPGKPVAHRHDSTGVVTAFVADFVKNHAYKILVFFAALVVFTVIGISRLTVENRFIDYFKQSTEIFQGMIKIDEDLGGTTPFEVIVNPTKKFYEDQKAMAEELEELQEEGEAGISATSYWFNEYGLELAAKVHKYLDDLPESGKVLSIASSMKFMEQLNDDQKIDNLVLAVLHKRVPEEVRSALFNPYMSKDGNQLRFAVRVFESDYNLKRKELIARIKKDLVEKIGLKPEQIHVTGMVVLYNNMLQSLFDSQILTIGVVFIAIMLMFLVLFRSFKISLIAIIPNMVAAGMVLGMLGWLKIPLDIMTITIAAITIGIAVDNSIHYIYRFLSEVKVDGDYWAAVKRTHISTGRAMYYTSITITLGFSILALSNFIPTIYFGLFTGMAMMMALIANLTLLPVLLVKGRA